MGRFGGRRPRGLSAPPAVIAVEPVFRPVPVRLAVRQRIGPARSFSRVFRFSRTPSGSGPQSPTLLLGQWPKSITLPVRCRAPPAETCRIVTAKTVPVSLRRREPAAHSRLVRIAIAPGCRCIVRSDPIPAIRRLVVGHRIACVSSVQNGIHVGPGLRRVMCIRSIRVRVPSGRFPWRMQPVCTAKAGRPIAVIGVRCPAAQLVRIWLKQVRVGFTLGTSVGQRRPGDGQQRQEGYGEEQDR
jgi:hypothetical protein